MAIDPFAAVDRDGFVQQLRALKAASGKSTTQIAADGSLSTSGIEGMLAGKHYPTEETVRGFAQACGVDPRSWAATRNRIAASLPRTPRITQAYRDELETQREHNIKFAEAIVETGVRVEELEKRVSAVEAAAVERQQRSVDQWALIRLRLIRLVPNFEYVPPQSTLVGINTRMPLPGIYAADAVDKAVGEIRALLAGTDPMALISHLVDVEPFKRNLWLPSDLNERTCAGGYRVEEVDRFFIEFRVEAADAMELLL